MSYDYELSTQLTPLAHLHISTLAHSPLHLPR